MSKSHDKIVIRVARVFLDVAQRLERHNAVAVDLHRLVHAFDLMEKDHLHWATVLTLNHAGSDEALVASLDGQLKDPFTRFALRKLARFGLLAELPAICHAFLELLDERQNRLRIAIASAKPLEADQRLTLVANMAVHFDKNIIPAWQVDPALIAGFTYRTETCVGDFSARGMLDRLAAAMAQARSPQDASQPLRGAFITP